MKGYCLLVIAVVVLLLYQREPFYTFVFLGAGIIIYMVYKARKSGNGFFGGFLSGKSSTQDNTIEDLVSLIMLQQLLSENSNSGSSNNTNIPDKKREKELAYLEKTQKEVLKLLESK